MLRSVSNSDIKNRIMPRIIEAKVGKVAGPLRMKVAQTTPTPKSEMHDCSPALSSGQEIRRGRHSRRSVNGLKKSRSKSLPSSKQSAFLFGKPPDDDDSLEPPIDHSVKLKSSKIVFDKNLRVAFPKVDVPDNYETSSSITNKVDPSCDLTPIDDEFRSNSTALADPSQQRYALAIDTRCLSISAAIGNGSESFNAAKSMIRNCQAFTKSLHSRGITPCIVASTTASDKTRSCVHYTHENKRVAAALADLGLGIETHKLLCDSDELRKATDIDDDILYTQVEIPSNKLKNGAISIPLALNATYSWLLFSAMVDAIVAEDTKVVGFVSSSALKTSNGPINITIICSDVSLFCDTNVDSHRTGLQAFIDHMTPYFRRGLLSSISIITAAKKGQLALSVEADAENEKNNSLSKTSPDFKDVALLEMHQTAMQECVSLIEWTLDDIMVGIHSSHHEALESSICCSFTMIKNSIVDFMTLSHSMLRKALVTCNTRLACRLPRIDLPVSGDGTNCSISLEASYEMFPFMVQSYHGKFISSDLDDLSIMNLEVVQSIPLSMVDVSLLFGIPLVVRAGLEKDYAQYQEMKLLVRSLFTVLQKQERAILLRGSSPRRLDKRTTSIGPKVHTHVGFSYPSEQYFLLMSQEAPMTMINTEIGSLGPSSGLLLRIAHVDYLLHDSYMVDDDRGQYTPTDDENETVIQYMEYIENSLSTLNVCTYNPFTISLLNNERCTETNIPEHVGDKGLIPNVNCDLDEAPSPMNNPMSVIAEDNFHFASDSNMDISDEAGKLSIYDLHAVTDDMSQ